MSRLIQIPALVVILLLSCVTLLQAEVAVNQTLGQPPTTTLSGIVVDPDPINGAWGSGSGSHSTKFVLNPNGDVTGDGPPSAAFAPDSSLPSVVWSKNTPSGFDIVISCFDGSQWTAESLVSGDAADELDPKLAIDPLDGTHHVVYWINDGAPRVLYRSAPADLSSWSAPVQVSHLADIAVRPSLTFFEGELYVVYELHSGGLGLAPRQIAVALWDGANFSSEIISTTQHAGANRPIIHAAPGRMWIEWIDSATEMAWTRRVPAAGWATVDMIEFQNAMELFRATGRVRQLALE